MVKPWRLTRRARSSLVSIARWTIATFGPRQAQAYEDDLIAECRAIGDGTALTRSCGALVDRPDIVDLRFCRAGQHFVIFIETPAEIIIVDFLHARSDLPRKLSLLSTRRQGR